MADNVGAPPPRRATRVLRWLAIAAALLAFSVYATWPLARHMGDAVKEDDPFTYMWDLWWVARSIVHLDNPWFSSYLLAPDGSYLAFHSLTPLLGVLAAPVTLLFGPLTSYNLLKLIIGPIAAATAYLMGRSVGLSRPAAWVTGGLYGFSTITIWRSDFHLNLGGALPLLPLVIWAAVRYERERRRRDALLTGALLGAVVLVDPTMAVFAAIALGLWILVAIWDAERRRLWLHGVGFVALATIVVASPQLAMMVRAADRGAYAPNKEVLAATWVAGATSLRTMASPADVAPWFPSDLESWAYRHARGEATPTYGWGALLLGLVGIVVLLFARRGPPARLGRRAMVWGLVVLVAGTVLALGPVLTLSDTAHRPLAVTQHGQQLSALMPYTWLVQLPLMQDVRVPARFVMLGMLGLSLLAGFGFAALWRRGIAARGLAVAALLFAAVEAGYPDGGVGATWVPGSRAHLYAPVRADKSDSIVVDIPLAFVGSTYGAGRAPDKVEPMLRATEHGHRMAFGFIGRLTPAQISHLMTHPFYAAVMAQQGSGPDDAAPLPAGDLAALRKNIAEMRVGWVVVWPSASRRVPAFLRSLGFTPVTRQDGSVLWRAPAPG